MNRTQGGVSAHRCTNADCDVFILKNLIIGCCRKKFPVQEWGNYCIGMNDGSHLAMHMTRERLAREGSGAPIWVSRSKTLYDLMKLDTFKEYFSPAPGNSGKPDVSKFMENTGSSPHNPLVCNRIEKLGIALSNLSVPGYVLLGEGMRFPLMVAKWHYIHFQAHNCFLHSLLPSSPPTFPPLPWSRAPPRPFILLLIQFCSAL